MKTKLRSHFICCTLFFILQLITSCASVPSDQRIDNVPMYGQPEIPRPDVLKQADEDFIKQAISGFGGNRELASSAWYSEADKFMNEGNLDFAMRRYNQSWLLNPNNYQPYWGFARVMVAKHQYDEAFKYFQKANSLINDSYQKPALLSDTAVAYHNKANSTPADQLQEKQKYFALANRYFKESTDTDPKYAKAWLKWSQSLYFQGNYEDAWKKIKKAKALDPSIIPNQFISDLSAKLPEPI